jgi:hypothetical protein
MPRCLLALLLTGCTTAGTVGTIDPNDLPYNDPYGGAQNVHLPDERIEIAALPPGTEQIVDVVVQNVGPFELQIESVRLAGWSDAGWTLLEDTVPAVIGAESEVTVQVAYVAPLGRDSFASLEVRSDDPDEGRVATGLIGRAADGAPEPRLDPPVLDFGFVFRDQEARSTITVRNDGLQPFTVLDVALEQSVSQPAFGLSCPGQPIVLDDGQPPACATWAADVLAPTAATPIEPGGSATFEVAYVPTTPITHSGQLTVTTTDPLRPTITATVRGNGDGTPNCTPPTIELLSPTEPVWFLDDVGAHLQIEARVTDAEQPAGTMFVELWAGDLLIEDEFTLPDGRALFDIDVDLQEEPELPHGLQTLTLRAVDACPLTAETTFVALFGGIFTGADGDADGWTAADGDCDDGDPSVYPGAHEARDAKDNDCDGDIDDGTALWDNDCDGYCADPDSCLGQGPAPDGGDCAGLAAEPFGDCNDRTGDADGDGAADGRIAHPGADEIANHLDDDCDGAVDEGTVLRDDDGDGMSENAGDCDDEEATVFDGALEWCDGLDNDCAGGVDDDCLETTHEPRLAGPVRVDRFEIALGTRVEARVVVLAEEGAEMSFEWVADKGTFTGETDRDAVTWQSPEDAEENLRFVGSFANLQATVRDAEGRVHNEFGEVHITATNSGSAPVDGTGCSAAGGGGLLAGLLMLLGRRRRLGLLAAVLALGLAAPASAAELGGVMMADSVVVAGKTLPLQGLGLRKMLMIKVYVAGLYTDAGASAEAVVASKDAKAVVMTMKIGLSGEKVGDSIEQGFERNSGGSMGTLRTRLDQLKALFPAFEKGDTVMLAFDPARGTVLTSKGKELGVIEGKDFADALFKVWLGADPVDEDLKAGMLGG